jgi:arsenate reductase-like glutaredoxin family protein
MTCLDMAMPYLERFGAQLPQLAGHGMDILPSLADANPKAQFVVSEDQLSDILSQERICPLLNNEEAAWSNLEQAMQETRDSLVTLIRKYAINYVHLSWGLEDKGLRERFQSCGTTPPNAETINRILKLYGNLFQDITHLQSPTERGMQPVYIFQAAPSSSYPLTGDDQLHSLDCRSIPGRIRVNAASYHGFDVPEEGRPAPFALASHEANGKACTDFYVVTGYKGLFDPEARAARIPSGPLGLGHLPSPSWPSASSFANPLGLSFFLYERQKAPQSRHDEILKALINKSSPQVYDPLLHQQLQIFKE